MTIIREIVDRDELRLVLGTEQAFVEKWTSAEAREAYRNGTCEIPPMPVILGMGKAWKFHLASVREWLLKYFQQGGEAENPNQGKRKEGRK